MTPAKRPYVFIAIGLFALLIIAVGVWRWRTQPSAPTTPAGHVVMGLDNPDVAVVAPVDGSVIMPDQTLTVLFRHPVRHLNEEVAATGLLTIQPPVQGKFNWLGTSAFEFVPANGWPAATEFVVSIPNMASSTANATTTVAYSWKFNTAPLSASLVSEPNHHRPQKPIIVGFNYPIKPEVIKTDLIVKESGSVISNEQLSFKVGKDDPKTIEITKIGNYTLGKSYEFQLPKNYHADLGPLGLTDAWDASVGMDELGFRITAACPEDHGEFDPLSNVAIAFNNPLDLDTVSSSLQISPALQDQMVSRYGWSNDPRCQDQNGNGHVLTISGRWRPSTKYAIRIGKNLADVYRQNLSEDKIVKLTTLAFGPKAELSSYSTYGILAAHLPRQYQLRGMNLKQPITAEVCSLNFDDYLFDDYLNVSGSSCHNKASKTFDSRGKLNTFKIIDLDLDKIAGQPLALGAYELNVAIPDFHKDYWQSQQNRLVLLTDTAVTLKRDASGKLLVWATDMKTGQPVADLDLDVWNSFNTGKTVNHVDVASGKTDKNGLASLTLDKNISTHSLSVRVQGNGHFGFTDSDWDDGIAAWNYSLQTTYQNSYVNHIGYVYTDRRIYRPDQLVQFKGIVRLDTDARLSLPTLQTLTVAIEDPDNHEISRQTLPLSPFGSFHGSFQLSPTMAIGSYGIRAVLPKDGNEGNGIQGGFDVREYRRPDFKVTANQPPGTVFAGQDIRLPIHAEYYQGVPLSNAHFSYTVSRTKLFFQPLPNEWYNFDKDDGMFDCYWNCRNDGNYETIANADATLDQNGDAVIALPANLTDYKFSATYALDVTVTDNNQRQVSNHAEFPVHKGAVYLGIRSDYRSGWDSMKADFDIISLNADQTVHPSFPAKVSLYRRSWSNVKIVGSDGGASWDSKPSDVLLASQQITTDHDGKAHVSFSPTGSGEFVAVVDGQDGHGNNVNASDNRYIYRDDFSNVRVTDDHQLRIVQNKASYNVGDVASLAVQTPYANAKALVSVERNSIRSYYVTDLGTKKRLINLPITEDMTPNVYVSVLTVSSGSSSVPEFRLGYANLQVNTTKKILQLQVTPDKSVYKPGDHVTLTVTAKNPNGQPASAEVSLAVVDERVVSLLGSIDKNILGKFWFPRDIGVATSQTLTKLVKKIFFATNTEGGGGGKGGQDTVPAIRGNFRDTAYWNADVTTDSSGQAQVSFDLPDNLTSWQLLAIGTTKDTVVGSAEASIKTRKDLMVEPMLPRILRQGDKLPLGATVFNATDHDVTLSATIDAQGVQVLEPSTKTITVASGARQVVNWNVQVSGSEAPANIKIYAKSDGLSDGFAQSVPILPSSVPELVTASGILARQAGEHVDIPMDILTNSSSTIRVSVQPNIGNGFQRGLDYLVHYPYGCAEQLTSGMIGNLIYGELIKLKLATTDAAKQNEAKKNVETAISLIIPMQHADGGFGFWPDSPDSYVHLTAYVLWGLTQAQKAGFSVDQDVLARADQYLRNHLAGALPADHDVWWNEDERAQSLFMLSERNPQGLTSYVDGLYDRHQKLSAFAKAFLAMAYGNIDGLGIPPSHADRVKQLLSEIRNSTVYLNATTAYVKEQQDDDWMMGSDVQSTSLYLKALLRLDPSNTDIDRLVRYLVEQRKDGNWETTHNTAMALLGLLDYARANPVDDHASNVKLFLDQQAKPDLNFPQGDVSGEASVTYPISELITTSLKHTIELQKDTDKHWFYDVTMKTYKDGQTVQPFENGFTLIANVYSLKDKKNEQPISTATQGDNVRVHLKLLVPKQQRYVAMEYHLPAGLEAIDFSLKTSPQQLAGETQQCAPTFWGEQRCLANWELDWWWENVWKHIEQRDDRVFLFAEHLDPGIYEYDFLASAVTPGSFHIPPARVYAFYNPLANAHNEGRLFTITAK